MNYIEITKENVMALLFEGENIGMGTNGIIKEVNSTTLAKINYKEIIGTYLSRDSSKLDEEINTNKMAHEMLGETVVSEAEMQEQKKLQYLFKIGLLKGILMYNGYKIGVLLNYYKDYLKLTDVSHELSSDSLKFLMESIRSKLEELMQNGVFPRDLKEDNILVRQKDLDVVFIDLDDPETRFEEMDYILTHIYIKRDCLERYNQMKKRLCKR